MGRIVCATLALIFLTACGPSPEQLQPTIEAAVAATLTTATETAGAATATAEADVCGETRLIAYAETMEQQLDRVSRQVSVADSTPRVGLGVALQELFNLQNEIEALDHPECAANFHENVVSMVGLYRLAYQTFAAQGDDLLIQASLTMANNGMNSLRDDLEVLYTGAVPSDRELKAP